MIKQYKIANVDCLTPATNPGLTEAKDAPDLPGKVGPVLLKRMPGFPAKYNLL